MAQFDQKLQFDLIGRDVSLTRTLDKAGDSFKDTAKDAGQLDRQLAKTKDGLAELIREFDRTGDRTLFKDMERLQKDLTGSAAGAVGKAGAEAGVAFGQGFAVAAAMAGKAAIPLLVGAVVAAVPTIGAAIGAGVLGGAGGLGIIGGIALAARDPRVAAAGAAVGHHLLESFTAAAEPFTLPLIDALGILQAAGDNAAAELGSSFRGLAPLLTPLAEGISGLIREAMPGFKAALEAAKPVLRVLANEMPEIGAAISDFLTSISGEGDAAAMVLTDLLKTTASLIRLTGMFVGHLAGVYELVTRLAAVGSGWAEDVFGWIPGVGGGFRNLNNDLEDTISSVGRASSSSGDFAHSLFEVVGAADKTSAAVQHMSDAISALFTKTLDPIKAAIAYEQAIDDLEKELRDGITTLNENTQEGRDNAEMLIAAALSIDRIRAANSSSAEAAEHANKVYAQQFEALRRQALAAGFAADEVDRLIGRLYAIPQIAENRIIMKGIVPFSEQRSRERQLEGRAHGGSMLPGRDYVVGEHGIEIVRQGASGGQVFNNSQTTSMLSGASGGMAQSVTLLVQLIDPQTGAVTRQAQITDALNRGVPESTVAAAYP